MKNNKFSRYLLWGMIFGAMIRSTRESGIQFFGSDEVTWYVNYFAVKLFTFLALYCFSLHFTDGKEKIRVLKQSIKIFIVCWILLIIFEEIIWYIVRA